MSNIQHQMQTLLASLDCEVFTFQDDSHLHAGHAGNTGGGHYTLHLVSPKFEGQNRITRQRTVQTLLAPLFMNQQIHALSIRAQTPQEYFN